MCHKLKSPLMALSLGLLFGGCDGVKEEALQADTAEASASDLITFFLFFNAVFKNDAFNHICH